MSNHSRKKIEDRESRIAGEPGSTAILNPQSSILASSGFTLLELVMVMTIMVVLAAIGVTSYQHIQLKARETVLKKDLADMRKMIDEYAADREKLPSTIQDLVDRGYIREIPVDPITGEKNWIEDQGDDTVSRDGGQGMVDVHSSAVGEGTDGVPYKEY